MWTRIIAVMLLVFALTPIVAADELGDAIRNAKESLKGRSFVAKVPLRSRAKYDVLPDGRPVDDAKQARRLGRPGLGVDEIALNTGETGHWIWLAERGGDILVQLGRASGFIGTSNSALVYIRFDRPLRPSDFDPAAIASALSGIATIQGYEPGASLAKKVEQLDAAGSPPAPRPAVVAQEPPTRQAPAAPTVLSVRVSAEPARLRRGEDLRLLLEFEVAGATAAVTTRETRELSIGGAPVPGFPVVDELPRASGVHQSSYRQPIPASARSGEYRYRGEVCVQDDCIARSVTVVIDP